jgi:hypothetical protein
MGWVVDRAGFQPWAFYGYGTQGDTLGWDDARFWLGSRCWQCPTGRVRWRLASGTWVRAAYEGLVLQSTLGALQFLIGAERGNYI